MNVTNKHFPPPPEKNATRSWRGGGSNRPLKSTPRFIRVDPLVPSPSRPLETTRQIEIEVEIESTPQSPRNLLKSTPLDLHESRQGGRQELVAWVVFSGAFEMQVPNE